MIHFVTRGVEDKAKLVSAPWVIQFCQPHGVEGGAKLVSAQSMIHFWVSDQTPSQTELLLGHNPLLCCRKTNPLPPIGQNPQVKTPLFVGEHQSACLMMVPGTYLHGPDFFICLKLWWDVFSLERGV